MLSPEEKFQKQIDRGRLEAVREFHEELQSKKKGPDLDKIRQLEEDQKRLYGKPSPLVRKILAEAQKAEKQKKP